MIIKCRNARMNPLSCKMMKKYKSLWKKMRKNGIIQCSNTLNNTIE